MGSTFRILTIVLSIIIILTSIPNIIYYVKASSGNDSDINTGFATFMLWLNVVLIVIGVGIGGYAIFSSFMTSPEEPRMEEPKVVYKPRVIEKQEQEPEVDERLSKEFSEPEYEKDIEEITDLAVQFN